jgi:plasmid stabilization system protein ParE
VEPTQRERRDDLIASLHEVSTAIKALIHRFDDLDFVTQDAIDRLEGGANALTLAASMGLADRRQALNVAVERVRKGRHELLRAMFLLALNEGSSRAEIARVWHVSRQLVSRMTGEELED